MINIKIDKQQLRKILQEELGYNQIDSERVSKQFPDNINTELESVFSSWLKDRSISNKKVLDDISVPDVMKAQGCNFILAIEVLNRVFDPDITSEQKERIKEGLLQPVIRW